MPVIAEGGLLANYKYKYIRVGELEDAANRILFRPVEQGWHYQDEYKHLELKQGP